MDRYYDSLSEVEQGEGVTYEELIQQGRIRPTDGFTGYFVSDDVICEPMEDIQED